MAKPTKKQTLLLEYIADFSQANNYSPSYREIMHALGLKSVSAVAEHIDNCVAAGFLNKIPNTPRSLEVIAPKTYEETIELFRTRIRELKAVESREKDIATLRSAAKILGIKV